MLMDARVIMDSEAHLLTENVAVQEGEHGIASATPIHIVPQQPGNLFWLVLYWYASLLLCLLYSMDSL